MLALSCFLIYKFIVYFFIIIIYYYYFHAVVVGHARGFSMAADVRYDRARAKHWNYCATAGHQYGKKIKRKR